jgi:hypothetical protein
VERSGKTVAGVKQFLASVAAANAEGDIAASIDAGKWLMQVGARHPLAFEAKSLTSDVAAQRMLCLATSDLSLACVAEMTTYITTWELLPNERVSVGQANASAAAVPPRTITQPSALEGLYLHMLIQGDAATINTGLSSSSSEGAAAPISEASASSVSVFKGGSLLMGPSVRETLGSLKAIGPCLAFLSDTSYTWLIPLTQATSSSSSSSAAAAAAAASPPPWREYIAQSRCIIASLPLARFFWLVEIALDTVRQGLDCHVMP